MKIIHEFTLDVSRHGVQCTVPMTQNDAGVHRFVIHLRNGSVPIVFRENDGAVMYIDTDTYDPVTVYTENGAYPNCAVYDVSPSALQESGEHRAVLQIYRDASEICYTPEMMLAIRKDITVGSAVLESPQYAAVVKAQAAAEEAARVAEETDAEMRSYVDEELEALKAERGAALDAYKQEVAEDLVGVDEELARIKTSAEQTDTEVKQARDDISALKEKAESHDTDIEEIKRHDETQDAAIEAKADLVDGKVPAHQLPSFVDDVIEGDLSSVTMFKDTDGSTVEPKSGKLYIDVYTGRTYRWSGSMYAEVSSSLALGETSSTAYRGDRGKYAYAHATQTGNPHGTKMSDIEGLDDALNGRVSKIGGISAERRVYAVTPEGEQTELSASSSSQSRASLVLRDENGNYGAEAPVENGHVANKGYVNSVSANALKGTVSGSAVAMNDVSPAEHELTVKVSSKNLLPYPYVDTTKTENGLDFVDNGNGSITINGTATTETTFRCQLWQSVNIKAGSYSFSGGLNSNLRINYAARSLSGSLLFDFTVDGDGRSITITEDVQTLYVVIRVASGTVASNVTICPQIEKGTTVTAYTPYIEDLSTVSVSKHGKNLLHYPYVETTKTTNGITFIDNGDGTITANGTATENAVIYFAHAIPVNATTYALSGCPKGGGYETYLIALNYKKDGEMVSGVRDTGDRAIQDFTEPTEMRIYILIMKGTTISNLTFKPQLELGTTATSYEPYIEPTTYTVGADGTVEGVTSLYPTTTLIADNSGALIDCEYNRDINKAFDEITQAIISLGGNI